jgi:hypothetical protein
MEEYQNNLENFLTEKLMFTEYRTPALRCISQSELVPGTDSEKVLLMKAQVYATLEVARNAGSKK